MPVRAIPATCARSSSLTTETFLTIEEVANLLKVSSKTVRRLVQKGELPGFRVGNQWRFKAEQIESWADAKVADGSNTGTDQA